MPDKEKMVKLIDKWDFLLEGLGKAKYKLYKYSRIYENTSNKNADKMRILLPLEYRIFKKMKDINVSRSCKNSITIFETEAREINHMNLDSVISLLDATSDMIIERMIEENINAINKIELEEKDGQYSLSIFY